MGLRFLILCEEELEKPLSQLDNTVVSTPRRAEVAEETQLTPKGTEQSLIPLLIILTCIVLIPFGIMKVLQWKTVGYCSLFLLSSQAPRLFQNKSGYLSFL
eukprot:TRINITY_DN1110_c0_g1_i1.p1 TRINITY_DN1110_c0_g1~~TRINITY_DN1110_c0_g1_i1.p1  ORF type:complete len:101 (+),score=10.05 TRINITY_DN1110_c0_g1_i1:48-350(+)